MRAMTPEAGVQALPGVGKRAAEALERLGVATLRDLLAHYPARWVDRREIRPIRSLTAADAGMTEEDADGASRRSVVTVLGKVTG